VFLTKIPCTYQYFKVSKPVWVTVETRYVVITQSLAAGHRIVIVQFKLLETSQKVVSTFLSQNIGLYIFPELCKKTEGVSLTRCV